MKEYHFISKIVLKSTVKKIKEKTTYLGMDNYNYGYAYLYFRLIISILLFLTLFIFTKKGFFVGPIAVVFFYYFSEYVFFDLPKKRRKKILEKDGEEFFWILSLILKKETRLITALKKTCNDLPNNALTKEFLLCLEKVSVGKPLFDALEEMQKRIPSEKINEIIVLLMYQDIKTVKNKLVYHVNLLRKNNIDENKHQLEYFPLELIFLSLIFYIIFFLLLYFGPKFIMNYMLK